jgi:hypothetical protein
MSGLWLLVKASMAVVLVSILILLFLPKSWIAASSSAADSLRRMGLPPWSYLNNLGRAAYVVLYISGALLLVLLGVGAWLEKT